jgi:hypothetical protein
MNNVDEMFEKEFKGIKDIEHILFLLREEGLTQIQSIAFLKKKTDLSLKEIDTIVLNSKTWNDAKNKNIEFRNSIWDKLE